MGICNENDNNFLNLSLDNRNIAFCLSTIMLLIFLKPILDCLLYLLKNIWLHFLNIITFLNLIGLYFARGISRGIIAWQEAYNASICCLWRISVAHIVINIPEIFLCSSWFWNFKFSICINNNLTNVKSWMA